MIPDRREALARVPENVAVRALQREIGELIRSVWDGLGEVSLSVEGRPPEVVGRIVDELTEKGWRVRIADQGKSLLFQ